MQPQDGPIRKGTRGALLLVASLALGAAAPAVAAEVAGLVVAVRGDVSVTHADGRAAPLALKDSVWPGDRVRTGDRGRLQICFADDAIMSLGRNTQVEIAECVFKRSEGQGVLNLNINEGVFRIVGGAIMKVAPENFRAVTPTATIGIRGSSFAAEVTPKTTTVVLLGTTGAGITVSNEDGYRIVYIPGTGLTVPLGQAPGAVEPMDAVAEALLGQTSVGGSGTGGVPAKPEAAPAGDGAVADPHALIPGYPTDAEAQAALDEQLPGGSLPMWHGNAVGLDLTNGWALRSLDPDEVTATVAIEGERLAAVLSGGMLLHAQGTGNSADTFPDGPVSAPAIPFTFDNGAIVGNPAITVTHSSIQPPDAPAGISNWGWWEMDMSDPNGSATHHAVGLWQATSLARTAADFVHDVLLGRDFTGTYSGSAHCLRNGVERFDGASRFALDFREYAFTGDMDFGATGGPDMSLAGTINDTGIHGTINTISGDSAVRSSSMRGFFYGDRAQSLQGAFDAQTAVNRYIGIFDASGGVTPAHRR